MSRVVHFEFNVDDPSRAIQFYSDVFGWKIEKWEGPMEYYLVMTGEEGQPGIDGGLMMREDPAATTVVTVDVASVDEIVEKIKQSGGEVLSPKSAVPGVGYMAYCRDTEGNTFGLMQSDTSAA